MTLFLHIPELNAGIDAAQTVIGNEPDDNNQEDLQKARLIAQLDSMLSFAQDNLQNMLQIMGVNDIDDLNRRLQLYKDTNLSLAQIFPAFSAPMITEALARNNIGVESDGGYGLLISALEDRVRAHFEEYANRVYLSSDIQNELRAKLNNPELLQKLGIEIAGQLFGGLESGASLGSVVININTGAISWGNTLSNLSKIINQSAKMRGATGTNIRTIEPFISRLIIPFLQNALVKNMDFFINENSYQLFEQELRTYIENQPSEIKRQLKSILRERVSRGGITVDTSIKSTLGNDNQIISYLDALKINVDPNLFNINNRPEISGKRQSIENYVEEQCNLYPEVRKQITQNIKDVYWRNITSYLPSGIDNPIKYSEFSRIIDEMAAPQPKGSIGWFFSQGTTKAGGVGMFGEIISMIYMSILCPKLKDNFRTEWAGGITGLVKPPADVMLTNGLAKYGIQVKNYTSGSTLSHDYLVRAKNMIDEIANNSINQDFMLKQVTSELGISAEEVDAIQNVIIANSFNVPYDYSDSAHQFVQVASVPAFSGVRSKLSAVYLRATKYMAVISVIMHRLQYAEQIGRWVTSSRVETNQLQNTLWLVNGSLFVSSVQILQELKNY